MRRWVGGQFALVMSHTPFVGCPGRLPCPGQPWQGSSQSQVWRVQNIGASSELGGGGRCSRAAGQSGGWLVPHLPRSSLQDSTSASYQRPSAPQWRWMRQPTASGPKGGGGTPCARGGGGGGKDVGWARVLVGQGAPMQGGGGSDPLRWAAMLALRLLSWQSVCCSVQVVAASMSQGHTVGHDLNRTAHAPPRTARRRPGRHSHHAAAPAPQPAPRQASSSCTAPAPPPPPRTSGTALGGSEGLGRSPAAPISRMKVCWVGRKPALRARGRIHWNRSRSRAFHSTCVRGFEGRVRRRRARLRRGRVGRCCCSSHRLRLGCNQNSPPPPSPLVLAPSPLPPESTAPPSPGHHHT
jgi:hypothetical protein